MPRNQPVERLALHVLHGDEVDALGLIDVVDGDDVGMIQRRSCSGLLNKPPPAVGISHALWGQHFERHHAAELGVFGLVDHTHAPAPQLL
jgi:hypothetical protein